ncbi:T9SS type A sorting domain-containing protein [uncultured Algibacter sp.]|uniref:T9SS type A sorting domain-containing protein n=1 Tax=uncultured Algibacter sp. TaxID=298659 RepID=UPI002616D221|nr:T9SS type A sorting domain-containing protein [uncultured Algibacter sp.]
MFKKLLFLLLFVNTLVVFAQQNILVNGSFNNGTIGWTTNGTVSVESTGLVSGSSESAQVIATNGKLSQDINANDEEWEFEFYFACQNPTLFSGANRGLNVHINNAEINLRIAENGDIQVYSGSWITIGSGNEISFSTDNNADGDIIDAGDVLNAHRLKIVGHQYGTGQSNYDVYVSEANTSVLQLVASGLTYFQGNPSTLTSVSFLSNFGMTSGMSYLVDECVLFDNSNIIIEQTSGSTSVEEEGATSDTFTIKLKDLPTGDVTINIAEVGTSYLNVTPSSVVFNASNYNNPKTITVTAIDDSEAQGGTYTTNLSFEVTSSDSNYNGKPLTDIAVFIKDNEPFVYPLYSGVYPHLAVTNSNNECGVGAIVPWQDDLWYVTYSPHFPNGSNDKLYQLSSDLSVVARPESVGGTPANRMIHSESNQLIIGSHIIDENKVVKTIPLSTMPGRMTANARHLTDPENRVYFVTMEEGIYDVDVNTLDFVTLHGDTNSGGFNSIVPGVHMKGAYTGQGRLMIANNGKGGTLSEWKGFGDGNPANSGAWTNIDVNKHVEITSKGGIYGATSPNDPIWSMGWDDKSVLLNVCDKGGVWKRFRMPKGSYTHDGDPGWYTEWPRIRDIGYGNGNYLMNMHGLMYQFPSEFSHDNTGGIVPFSSFLKMIVDYTEWNDQIVLACNDASKMGNSICPRAESNLLFTTREELDTYASTPFAFGGVWTSEAVSANTPSEAILISGYKYRTLHLEQNTNTEVVFTIEVDMSGDNNWTTLEQVTIPALGYANYLLPESLQAPWLRVVSNTNVNSASAYLHFANEYSTQTPSIISSIVPPAQTTAMSSGLIRLMSGTDMKLQFASDIVDNQGSITTGYYEMSSNMIMNKVNNTSGENTLRSQYNTTKDFNVDEASVIVESQGNQYRLPFGDDKFSSPFVSGWPRGEREIVTERSMMNIHGTFYELPRNNSGGMRRIRPITTHNKQIFDFCSWRGMLVLSGNFANANNDEHYKKSSDGKVGLWFGNVDDLFRMGIPKGIGSTWKNMSVQANTPSLPYIMQGYNEKTVVMSHNLDIPVTFTLQIDYLANGNFVDYKSILVNPGEEKVYEFPEGFNAHWVRTKVNEDCTATATFYYNVEAPSLSVDTVEDTNKIMVFPNPVQSELYVEGLENVTNAVVYDLFGKRIMMSKIDKKVNVSRLHTGFYILVLEGHAPLKFIKN